MLQTQNWGFCPTTLNKHLVRLSSEIIDGALEPKHKLITARLLTHVTTYVLDWFAVTLRNFSC